MPVRIRLGDIRSVLVMLHIKVPIRIRLGDINVQSVLVMYLKPKALQLWALQVGCMGVFS